MSTEIIPSNIRDLCDDKTIVIPGSGPQQGRVEPSMDDFETLVPQGQAGASLVARSRFVAVGNGPDKPVGDNKTADGREQNRRTDFQIIPNN